MTRPNAKAKRVVSPLPKVVQAYEEYCTKVLRAAGYRITMPRIQVIRALADTDTALTAYAVHEKIVLSGGKIDVVSVYRILDTLEELGLVHHIGIAPGYYPCRQPKDSGFSQVVVFRESGTVKELVTPEALIALIKNQAEKEGFEPHLIKVEISAR